MILLEVDTKRKYMSPRDNNINWYGWFTPVGGYGVVNLEYVRALSQLGMNVTIGWERYTENNNPYEWSMLNEENRALFRKEFEPAKVGIIKATPQHFYHNKSEVRIGYTMVENTRMGQEWVRYCNEMDAIFVPSSYLVEVFKESGVTVPIHVVKQGIDPVRYAYIDRPDPDTFIFATIGAQDERKNWQQLVQAFCSQFTKGEKVELWIKNTNPDFGNIGFKDERIKIINTFYTPDEMVKLYGLIDCLVFPSHAEGSGMPPREAMATGLPVILTNWSGLAEVCNPKFNYPLTPVAIDYPEADFRSIEQPGFQARLDVRELMYWMGWVYKHQQEAYEKGKKASKWIHENFSWKQCATEMLEIIRLYQ